MDGRCEERGGVEDGSIAAKGCGHIDFVRENTVGNRAGSCVYGECEGGLEISCDRGFEDERDIIVVRMDMSVMLS